MKLLWISKQQKKSLNSLYHISYNTLDNGYELTGSP